MMLSSPLRFGFCCFHILAFVLLLLFFDFLFVLFFAVVNVFALVFAVVVRHKINSIIIVARMQAEKTK